MTALYRKPLPCQSCMDLGWYDADTCAACYADRTTRVEVLQLGVGFFGEKAIIKDATGKLMTVRVDELQILEENEE